MWPSYLAQIKILTLSLIGKSRYQSSIMSFTKSASRALPVISAPSNSSRTEENQGYRRGRAIRSCLECRRRKMRCNRSRPCQNCNRFCRDCVYLAFPEWPSGAPNEIKVERKSQSPEQGGGRTFLPSHSNQTTARVQPSPFARHHNHHHGYNPVTLAKHDGTYGIDTNDDSVGAAWQIGRLGITENIGGFFRPHVASQVSVSHFFGRYILLCQE